MGMRVECCTLGVGCLLHFSEEMLLPACGAFVPIEWRDRKNALLIRVMPKCLAHSTGSSLGTG